LFGAMPSSFGAFGAVPLGHHLDLNGWMPMIPSGKLT
jgi:hypothetical protein